jgi:two-component system cell cycle sensor histidine kinase/response regulator CckA
VGDGTGLGLATVYGIVKQNKGFINAYSEPGQGTIFNVYLPRHQGEIDKPTTVTEEEQLIGGTESVLLVEDENMILRLATRMLERLGYTVLGTDKPEEATRLVQEHTSDIQLLITDLIMPGMNGRELAEKLSSIRPGLKCLYISGYTANVIAHHGVLDEGLMFLQKPFSIKDLAKKVREALEQTVDN